jgi:riboflavin kinase/FMN adenylyltransferase
MNKKVLSFDKAYQLNKTSIAIGFFDGLHLGHQELIKEIMNSPFTPAVLTFSLDLKSLVFKKKEDVILTEEEKENLLSSFGVKDYYLLPFSKDVMNATPLAFLSFLKGLNAGEIVVGEDFRFGDKAKGDVNLIKELEKDGIRVIVKKLLMIDNRKVSSSVIKELLKKGQIEQANKLLGYSFFNEGVVIHGLMNGRKLGYPTANMLENPEKIKLPDGVYKTITTIGDKRYASMTNIGNHPTIDPLNHRLIETNILGFSGNLYDQKIRVSFIKYLRPQQKFSSLDELKTQLFLDKKQCL